MRRKQLSQSVYCMRAEKKRATAGSSPSVQAISGTQSLSECANDAVAELLSLSMPMSELDVVVAAKDSFAPVQLWYKQRRSPARMKAAHSEARYQRAFGQDDTRVVISAGMAYCRACNRGVAAALHC